MAVELFVFKTSSDL